MKIISLKGFFKTNPDLLNEPEVQDLIEAYRDLEGELIECNQTKDYNKEIILLNMIRDIYSSCNDIIKQEGDINRFNESEPIDYKESIINLKKYISSLARDYKINL